MNTQSFNYPPNFPQPPNFPTESAAAEWMYEALADEDCFDNYRFAFMDDEDAIRAYWVTQEGGCCGFSDFALRVDGRLAMIGCNYGH